MSGVVLALISCLLEIAISGATTLVLHDEYDYEYVSCLEVRMHYACVCAPTLYRVYCGGRAHSLFLVLPVEKKKLPVLFYRKLQ